MDEIRRSLFMTTDKRTSSSQRFCIGDVLSSSACISSPRIGIWSSFIYFDYQWCHEIISYLKICYIFGWHQSFLFPSGLSNINRYQKDRINCSSIKLSFHVDNNILFIILRPYVVLDDAFARRWSNCIKLWIISSKLWELAYRFEFQYYKRWYLPSNGMIAHVILRSAP